MTTVACIGLGQMGAPMALNVVNSGFATSVFDIAESAFEHFDGSTARIASSPADAARSADVACIVVFDDAQTIETVAGSDGVLTTLKPGSVVAIHSTVSPETIRHLAQAGAEKNIHVIDAGISGGVPGATAGTLLTMVGGSTEAVALATPTLLAFSKEVIHAGDLGAGLALKLARNATGYIWMAGVHEAMKFASAAGVELEVLHHTISATGVFEQGLSPFMLGGPDPLPDGQFDPMHELLSHLRALGEKDLDQALGLAAELNLDVPVTRGTRTSFHSVARL